MTATPGDPQRHTGLHTGGPKPTRFRLKRPWLAATVVVGLVVVAVASREVVRLLRLRADVRAAREAVASRRYEAAEAPLGRWLVHQPDSAEAHCLKARTAFGLHRYAEAGEELDKAEKLGHARVETDRVRGFLLVLGGRYAEAEPLLSRVLAETPGPDPEADESLARCYLQTYKLTPAAKVLDRWIRDATRDPTPYLWYTEIDRRATADQTEAIAHYRAALQIDPNLDKARLGLADMLRAAHRTDEANAEYERYLARKPNDAAGHVGAGLNAAERGDLTTAGRELDRALELEPDNVSALKERAAIDVRLGRFPAALVSLDRAARLAPLDTEIMYRRRVVLSRLGRRDEAEKLQQQLESFRKDEAALSKTREQLGLDPSNNELRYKIARWMFDHGQDEEGVRWCKTILSAAPAHVATNRLLADHYERKGNTGLANFYRFQASGVPANAAPKSGSIP